MTIDEFKHECAEIGGCSDGYCVITGRAEGQHTNGGCRCYKDAMRMQLFCRLVQRFIREASDQEAANE